VIVIGSDLAPDDLAANHHRVGGEPAHPTGHVPVEHKKTRRAEAGRVFY
jgi:hypothetical protein